MLRSRGSKLRLLGAVRVVSVSVNMDKVVWSRSVVNPSDTANISFYGGGSKSIGISHPIGEGLINYLIL